MADKKIKKILIFACPRTGTTIIQKMIAIDLFGIPNLIEPFNNPELGFNPANPKIVNGQPADLYKWTQEQTSGVMKLLAINLEYVDINRLLLVGNFDRVVIVERKNLVDCCISLCLAEQTFKYHYYQGELIDVKPFKCDAEFVDQWISMYRRYLTALNQIKIGSVPYDMICYEDFINNQIQYIAEVPLQKSTMSNKLLNNPKKMLALELPYQELCTNYYEVEEKIRKELC
jgi:hypothetical protein